MNNKTKLLALSLLAIFMSASVKAGSLSETEAQLVSAINNDLPQAMQSLKQVVNINSGTMNFKGVKQVGDVFDQQLKALGFLTQWVDGSEFGRAGHLVASYGNSGPKILLIGHLDTVFSENDGFQKYEQLDSNRVAGPGITDMKGGDVMIVTILKALRSVGTLDKVNIKVVMTGDEELSGKPLSASKKSIVDAAKWADVALGFEDGDGNIQTAVTARRGAISWTLDVEGKPAHSSQIFRKDVGFGAAYELARILEAFRIQLSTKENLTFNPGLLLAGTQVNHQPIDNNGDAFGKNNVIAQVAKATGDIRAQSPTQLARTKALMKKIVASNLPGTQAKIIFSEGYPPMAATAGNTELLTRYNQISQELGYGQVTAVNPRRAGAADISFAAEHVDMALDGLGLMGTGGHTKNEVADISTFAKNAHKSAILIYRLSLEKD